MNLINNISIELKKIRFTPALKLAIFSGFFIPVIFFIYYVTKSESLIPKEGINPWDKFLSDQFQNTAPFLLPILFILQTSLVAQIDHKINGFKYVFTQPLKRWEVYLSKMFVALFLILVSYFVFGSLLLIVGKVVGFIHPKLAFSNFAFPYLKVLNFLLVTLIANLGIFSIQFWLSVKFKNFIVPIGIGMVLLISGLIVFRAPESIYFPYSYGITAFLKLNEGWFPEVIGWYSILCFLFFALLGCIELTRKNIN